ncbi:hypothetical protein ACJMK2_007218 [Sinanodonta woodiana]|uniref:Ig-like domain-containing protein n=1 Tax=Sinanodonta woodiana TaxID=1069815 RepID=A0ABD3VIY8_SINWO
MWHVYISFAVLFRGAFCYPVIKDAEHSNCTVVITHSGKQVETLEVKWNSTIHLICDASCVGPKPQLNWLYRDTNHKKLIKIKKMIPSPKFETYLTNSHRKNELVIRYFGPSEETDFICTGAIKQQRHVAKVALTGTGSAIPDIRSSYAFNYVYTSTTDNGRTGSAVTRLDVEVKSTRTSCEFRCRNDTCISSTKKCDGIPDCPDGDDELCDGAWSEWKNITLCYAKSCNISCRINQGHCEKGEMEQIRFCNNPYPGYGGSWCHGPVLRKVDCENHVRPGWSEWGPVKCDKDCKSSDNDTVQGSRRRTCTNPPPIYKNDICCGLGIETQDDNSTICKDLPKCIYTTVSTTAATSTTKVTCRTTAGFEYGDADQPKVPIKKDDDNSYDYSECS